MLFPHNLTFIANSLKLKSKLQGMTNSHFSLFYFFAILGVCSHLHLQCLQLSFKYIAYQRIIYYECIVE